MIPPLLAHIASVRARVFIFFDKQCPNFFKNGWRRPLSPHPPPPQTPQPPPQPDVFAFSARSAASHAALRHGVRLGLFVLAPPGSCTDGTSALT